MDSERFDSIFNEHHAVVYRYCVRRLGRSDGEDAAAEVLAVAWRRLDEIPPAERTRAWLIGVAYRVVGNHYRTRARRTRLSSRLHGMTRYIPSSIEAEVSADLDLQAVLAALDSLSGTDREVLRLAAWEGLSHGEIAAVLGIKENAVDQRLFRARSRLKLRFERTHGGASPLDSREAPA